jgi:hypothetical protein
MAASAGASFRFRMLSSSLKAIICGRIHRMSDSEKTLVNSG